MVVGIAYPVHTDSPLSMNVMTKQSSCHQFVFNPQISDLAVTSFQTSAHSSLRPFPKLIPSHSPTSHFSRRSLSPPHPSNLHPSPTSSHPCPHAPALVPSLSRPGRKRAKSQLLSEGLGAIQAVIVSPGRGPYCCQAALEKARTSGGAANLLKL